MTALSPTEWRVMTCLWALKVASPAELAEELEKRVHQQTLPKTVGILLARLEARGYVTSTLGPSPPRGRPSKLFRPACSHRDLLRHQIKRFLVEHLLDDGALAEFLTDLASGYRVVRGSNQDLL